MAVIFTIIGQSAIAKALEMVYTFHTITKSLSAPGCTRCWLGNTSTCPQCACQHNDDDDNFVICRNARLGKCLRYQADV